MLRDRLVTLFQQYDPALRQVILEVLEVEQEFISMERPRGIYDRIDTIVTRVADEELRRQDREEE